MIIYKDKVVGKVHKTTSKYEKISNVNLSFSRENSEQRHSQMCSFHKTI